MRKITLSLAALGAILTLSLSGTSVHAQLLQSWVASFGSNSNPCTRAQPCQTFTFALTKTAAGGEIKCVDQGEYGGGGATIINMSITIDCEDVEGAVLIDSFSTGFDIAAGPSDTVTLRGLDIVGSRIGETGIFFETGGALHVEKCVIHDFVQFENFGEGWGIHIAQTAQASAEIYVSDTTIINNGSNGNGGGILIEPSSQAGGVRKVVLNRVEVRNNLFGIKAVGGSAIGVINMTVRDSVSTGNAINGIVGTGSANGAAIVMMIDHSAASHNIAGFGVIADGPKTTIRLVGSSIAGNPNGVGVSNGGVLQSFGTNAIMGNSNDGIASLTLVGLH
ncbi:MAG: hypothetical protein JO273_16925 [Methylobacteriaceae bacterium]|nr:hypothetical protein [Methylobacteriaceae bacterium]